MSKLSFRARQLDASKPMPVFRADEIPDIHDMAAINRAVPQMPTGMEKEEEAVSRHPHPIWTRPMSAILNCPSREICFLYCSAWSNSSENQFYTSLTLLLCNYPLHSWIAAQQMLASANFYRNYGHVTLSHSSPFWYLPKWWKEFSVRSLDTSIWRWPSSSTSWKSPYMPYPYSFLSNSNFIPDCMHLLAFGRLLFLATRKFPSRHTWLCLPQNAFRFACVLCLPFTLCCPI